MPAREFRLVFVKSAGHVSDAGRGGISRRPFVRMETEDGECCSRHAIKARLEFVGQKVDIVLDLVVAKHPPLHRLLDPRQHLGDQHGREVLLRRARDEVPERRDDDAEDLFLDRLLGEIEQERDQVVPAVGACRFYALTPIQSREGNRNADSRVDFFGDGLVKGEQPEAERELVLHLRRRVPSQQVDEAVDNASQPHQPGVAQR